MLLHAKKKRKLRRFWWLSLLPILLLLAIYRDCGFLIPSSDTRQLRGVLAGTTRVEMTETLFNSAKQKPAVLTGKDARELVSCILLWHSARNYLNPSTIWTERVNDADCRFYNGKHFLAQVIISPRNEMVFWGNRKKQLYSYSVRRLNDFLSRKASQLNP